MMASVLAGAAAACIADDIELCDGSRAFGDFQWEFRLS
jgi:hypothetical protein